MPFGQVTGAHGVARVDATDTFAFDATSRVHPPDYDVVTADLTETAYDKPFLIDRVHPLDRRDEASANLHGRTHFDAHDGTPAKRMRLKTDSYDEDYDANESSQLRAAPGAHQGNCTTAMPTRHVKQHTVGSPTKRPRFNDDDDDDDDEYD
ncbi:hypothetical protein M885DRAFT_563663 [Pelagophyceae sp. CCMP2097]|nr:hypothetical protein M885DRAFT_563663 [Pelagophyceae sp. CCMP2097]